MGRKIVYLLILSVTTYLEIMYDTSWMQTLLAFELTLAAVMFPLSIHFRRSIRVFLKTGVVFAGKGEEIPVEIHVENKSFLPVCGVRVVVEYENMSAGRTEHRIVREHVAGKGYIVIRVNARSEYSGCVRFCINKVRVGDYLHLFSWPARRTNRSLPYSEVKVDVLPDMVHIPVEVTARTRNFLADSSEYETDRGGDDPSEVFQIREYRGGDRIRQIHWKMSARTDQLMVKEYSMPKGCKVLLLLDPAKPCENSVQADLFYEMAASVSISLLEAGCAHCAAWRDSDEGNIVKRSIQREEDVYEMLSLLMAVHTCEQENDLESAYWFAYPQDVYSTVVSVDMQGNLLCNGIKAVQSGGEQLRKRLDGFLLEV